MEAKYNFRAHHRGKEELGLPTYDILSAVGQLEQPRKHPTAKKVKAIKDALRYFHII